MRQLCSASMCASSYPDTYIGVYVAHEVVEVVVVVGKGTTTTVFAAIVRSLLRDVRGELAGK